MILRAAWAVRILVYDNEPKSVEVIFKVRRSFYCTLESWNLFQRPPVRPEEVKADVFPYSPSLTEKGRS